MKKAQQIYDGLLKYIDGFKNPKSSWYAGIASSPKDRLFSDHNVDEKKGQWAYDICESSEDARDVEEALLKLGCKGGGGGGDHTTKACYVYLITPSTRQ